MRKLTLEDAQIVAQLRGGKCLSKEYINRKLNISRALYNSTLGNFKDSRIQILVS